MRRTDILAVCALTLVLVAFLAIDGSAYNRYNGSPSCDDCHSGFVGGFGGPLHALHLNMTSTCGNCHDSSDDNPKLSNCAGCHSAEGLRLHHTNANAPADSNNEKCVDCHTDGAPVGENVAPPYYGQSGINLTDPCLTAIASGGEDYNGDGKGLDNDGDLVYDGNDVDCGGTPVEESTWGKIKALYQ